MLYSACYIHRMVKNERVLNFPNQTSDKNSMIFFSHFIKVPCGLLNHSLCTPIAIYMFFDQSLLLISIVQIVKINKKQILIHSPRWRLMCFCVCISSLHVLKMLLQSFILLCIICSLIAMFRNTCWFECYLQYMIKINFMHVYFSHDYFHHRHSIALTKSEYSYFLCETN